MKITNYFQLQLPKVGLVGFGAVMGLICCLSIAANAQNPVVGFSTVTQASPATSLTLQVPANTQTGDVLIAHISMRNGTSIGTITAPAGWTIIGSRVDNGDDLASTTYYRVVLAGDSPTASYTWSWPNSTRTIISMTTLRGLDTSNPIDAVNAQANAASTTITAPGVTTTSAGSFLLGFFDIVNVASVITIPSPYTGIYNQSTGTGGTGSYNAAAWRTFSGVGATGDQTVSSAQSNLSIGRLIAFRAKTYTISGTVTYNSSPLSGVTISASGGHSASVTTNASGVYTISGVVENATNITLTPSLAGYNFSPATLSVSGPVTANVTGQDFTASLVTYTISGTITFGGSPLPGVSVVATGGHTQTVTTNSSGVYTFTGVANNANNIVITPTLANYSFAPANRTISTAVTANVTGEDFTASASFISIAGNISKNGGGGIAGVIVEATGGHTQTVLTDSDGDYILTYIGSGNTDIRITPRLNGYSFDPMAINIAGPVSSSLTAQNFTGSKAPVANADFECVQTSTAINVLSNDTDPDLAGFLSGNTALYSVAIATNPAKGTVSVNGDKTIQFDPLGGTPMSENDQVTFTYTVTEPGFSFSSTAEVTVVYSNTNTAPTMVADAATTTKDLAISINVLANDSDDGPLPAPVVTVQPQFGSTTVNADKTITYTPYEDYVGTDMFTYQVTDLGCPGSPISGTAVVTVDVENAYYVCSGSSSTIQVNPVPGAESYSWTLPAGVTVDNMVTPFTGTLPNPVTTSPSLRVTWSGLAAGTYNIKVEPTNDCGTGTDQSVKLVVSQIAATTTAQPILCFGESTGSIDLNVSGGVPAYAYAWTNSSIPSFSNSVEDPQALAPGTYNYTVTDRTGCTATGSAIVTQQPTSPLTVALNGAISIQTNPTTPDGAINITVSGGTPNASSPLYSFAWSKVGSNSYMAATQNISGLAAGLYKVVVTDANGCIATAYYEVERNFGPLELAVVPTHIPCVGQSVGAIDLAVTGGSGGSSYSYSWVASAGGSIPSGQANMEDLSSLIAGTYTVTVSDPTATPNSAVATVVIYEPAAALSATISGTNVLCKGDNTGAADLTASGGTLPYTYLWNTGASTEDLSDLPAGSYQVTVTDANNCTTTVSITITEPATSLNVSGILTNAACAPSAGGAISVAGSGGTPGIAPIYTYAWSGPSGFTGTTSGISNLNTGVYGVEVTDANGCKNRVAFEVQQACLDVTKTVLVGPVNNGDGTYSLIYQIKLHNTGVLTLLDVQATDDLSTSFPSPATFSVVSVNSPSLSVNGSYDGSGDINLLAASQSLVAGEQALINLSLTVTPSTFPTPNSTIFNNTVNVSGTDVNGVNVTDSDVVPTTFTEMPGIEVTKSVTAGPVNNNDGTHDITYLIALQNTGNVPVKNIQVEDNLASVFPGATISNISVTVSSGLTKNTGYTGTGNNNLLTGTDEMAVNDFKTITLSFRVAPVTGSAGPFQNSAVATGSGSGGTPVTDNDQTPVTFTESPSIGIAKRVVGTPVLNSAGTAYTLTYEFLVENTGNSALKNVQVTDNLVTTFGFAPTIVGLSSATFAVNSSYNGNSDLNLLLGTDNLAIGGSGKILLAISVSPTSAGPFNNTAIATAQSYFNTPVTDDSQDGVDSDPDNDGPGDNSTPTPVSFIENPKLSVAKTVSTPVNNNNGTYSITYTITVNNVGNVPLSNVQVTDDLAATFTGVTTFSVTSVAATGGLTANNGGYNGYSNTNLLTGTNNLAVGATATIIIGVTVTPGTRLGVYNNTAIGTGQSPFGNPVSDVSQNGTNGDPDNDGNPGNNNAVTPLTFPEDPKLGVAKTLVGGAVANSNGTYTLTYDIRVQNLGDVPLQNVQIIEDFSSTFPFGSTAAVTSLNITQQPAGTTLTTNGSFAGYGLQTGLLNGTGTLRVGEFAILRLVVAVTPNSFAGPYENTAVGFGTSPGGRVVSDNSQDGTSVDPDNDGSGKNNNVPTVITLYENPKIGISKSVHSITAIGPIGTNDITFALKIRNYGDVRLCNLEITDDILTQFAGLSPTNFSVTGGQTLIPNGNWDGAASTNIIAPNQCLTFGEEDIIYISFRVTPGMETTRFNTANAKGTGPIGGMTTDQSHVGTDPDPDGNNTPSEMDPTPINFLVPALDLTKTITSGDPFTLAGDIISYSFTLNNSGTLTLPGPFTVHDNKIGTLTDCASGPLAPGASVTCTGNYVVTQQDVEAGFVTNTAYATTINQASTITSATVMATANGIATDLAITKSGTPNPVILGENITYTITVVNNGPKPATGVQVTDIIPNSLFFLGAFPGTGTWTSPTWNIGNLAANGSATMTLICSVITDLADGTEIVNTAQVSSTTPDYNPSNNTDSESTTALGTPSIQLTKTGTLNMGVVAPSNRVDAGDQITYIFSVSNQGNVPLNNVTITDPQVSVLGGPISTLGVGSSNNTTFTATYTITQDNIDAGTFTNTATVTGIFGGNPVTDSDDDTQVLVQVPALTIAKTQTGGPNPVTAASQVLNYTIVVTNIGNQTLTGLALTDVMPNGATITLSNPVESISSNGNLNVGETWTYTTSYTVTQADVDAAQPLVNTAQVISTQTPTPQTSMVSTPVQAMPSLSVVKTQTGGPNPVNAPGQVITYTIVVTNTGNQSLTGVTLTDMMTNGAVLSLGSPVESISSNGTLNVGETWTYSTTYTVTLADITAAVDLVNIASAVSTQTPTPVTDTETTEVEGLADLKVTKRQISGDNLPATAATLVEVNPSLVDAGTKVYYHLKFENLGTAPAINVTLSDPIPSPMTNVQYSLNFGNSWLTWPGTNSLNLPQFDVTPGVYHVLLRGDIPTSASGSMTNVSTINSAVTVDPVLSNNTSSVQTQIVSKADLLLDKTELISPLVIGGPVEYLITVTNLGPSDAANVVVTDVINPAVISGAEFSVNNGVSWSAWSGSYSVGTVVHDGMFSLKIRGTVVDATPQPNVNPVPNTASVTTSSVDPNPNNNSKTIQTPLLEEADLSVTKTGPASICAGETIQYTIVLSNLSNTFAATGAYIEEVLDDQIFSNVEYSLNSGTSWQPWDLMTNRYNLPTALAPLTNVTLLLRAKVLSNVTQNPISNTAIVGSNTPDNNLSNNNSSATTSLQRCADLAIVKTLVTPADQVVAGEVVEFLLTYRNNGPSDASNVVVTDVIPAGISNPERALCGTGVFGPWTGSANLGTVIAGGECVVNIRGTISADYIGALTNTASVQSPDVTDSNPDNNSSEITITVLRPSLELTKTADNTQEVAAGQTVTYTYNVQNTGNAPLSNVTVTDVHSGLGQFSAITPASVALLPVGQSVQFTATYVVTQADIDAGLDIENTATASGSYNGKNYSDTDDEIVDVEDINPMLELSKTANPTTYDAVGVVINYTIVASNTGNVTLSNVVVTDPNVSTGPVFASGDVNNNGFLDVGESWIYTATYIIQQEDLDAGFFVNVATATGTTPDGTPLPETATETVIGDQLPSWTLVKTSTTQPNTYDGVGDVLLYSIELTNTGNVTIQSVSVSDPGADATPGLVRQTDQPGDNDNRLEVGEKWRYTAQHTVTQADMTAGQYTNTATATGTPAGGILPPATDSETIQATQFIVINDVTVNESDGTMTFTVTLSGGVPSGFTVEYATGDNTALAPSDYATTTGTLSFSGTAGEVQTITIPIVNDAIGEPTESLFVNLSNSSTSFVVIADGQGTGTILDDDAVSVSINEVTVNEADGSLVFTVTLDGAIQDALSVDFVTANGTALQPGDYITTTGLITFPAGSASGTTLTISVPVTDDQVGEPTEQMTVNLSNINSTAMASIADGTGVGTILDDDAVSVSIGDAILNETGTSMVFVVTLVGNIQDALSVDYLTTNGTATQQGDFSASSGTVTFPAGSTNGTTLTITIPITDDEVGEATENFFVVLSNLQSTAMATITDNQGEGTILDDDEITLSISGFIITETDGAQMANFTISFSNPTQDPIVISFTTSDSTAVSGADYTAQNSVLYTIPGGEVTYLIPVTILGDLVSELNEFLKGTFSLVNVNGQPVQITVPTAIGAIIDDDIIANDDIGININGYEGGISVINVLSNDELYGTPPTLINTILSVVTPATPVGSNPVVPFLDITTATVIVPPGTPAGLYSITYRICEAINPVNCDDAVITVPVSAAPIVADPDINTTIIFGATGGLAIPTVLVNDSLNNVAVIPSEVFIKIPTGVTIPVGISINLNTGAVSVQPGTLGGLYQFHYELCEILNPTNCDTALVQVNVLTNPNPDVNSTFVGFSINGDVSTNDQLPDGTTYGTPMPQSTNPGVATLNLNADGTYTFISSIAGVFVYDVPVCPPGLTADCPIATLTINVLDLTSTTNQPLTNTDIGITRQGQPVSLNTFANDDPFLLGTALDPSSLAVVTPPVNGTLSIDPITGIVTYTPNPGFTGIDRWFCQVCSFPPSNTQSAPQCVTFIQEVTVFPTGSANYVLAADDYISSLSGVTVYGNVVLNDTDLEGDVLTVTPQNVSVPGVGTLVLNADGSFIFTPLASFIGPINFIYDVCDSGMPQACTQATLYLLVTPACLPPTELSMDMLMQTTATLSWTVNNHPQTGIDVTHHCWTITLGGSGYNGESSQAIRVFTICQGDPALTINGDRVSLDITGLSPGTCYQFTVAETCDGYDEQTNVSPITLSTNFCTYDYPPIVTTTTMSPSCPTGSANYAANGTVMVRVEHSSSCPQGIYEIRVTGGPGYQSLTPQSYLAVGAGNYTFAGAGVGTYTFEVREVSGQCLQKPGEHPVSASATVNDGVDNTPPVKEVRDINDNAIMGFGPYTLAEGDCSKDVDFYVYGVDDCAGLVDFAGGVTVSAVMQSGGAQPGTQATVLRVAPGQYLVSVNFAVGTTLLTVSAHDGYGNANSMNYTVTVMDNTAPVLSFAGSTQVLIPGCGTSATSGLTLQVEDGCADAVTMDNATVNFGAASAVVSQTGANYRSYVLSFPGPGTYPVTASYTDAAGNTGTASLTIVVSESAQSAPALIFANAEDVTIAACATCYPLRYGFTIVDDCEDIAIVNGAVQGLEVTNLPAGMTLAHSEYVMVGNQRSVYVEYAGCAAAGQYDPQIRYTDASGEVSEVIASIVVRAPANEAADIIMPSNLTFTSPSCGPLNARIVIQIIDDCDASIDVQRASFRLCGQALQPTVADGASGTFEFALPLGAAQNGCVLEASYEDNQGAVRTVSATLTVHATQDTWAPIIVYPAQDIQVQLSSCNAGQQEVCFEVTATDNCTLSPTVEVRVNGLLLAAQAGTNRYCYAVSAAGTYVVEVRALDASGNERVEDFRIVASQVVAGAVNLSCVGMVNLTLDANCQRELTASQVLTGSFGCLTDNDFEIVVIDGNPSNGATIDGCGIFTYEIRLRPGVSGGNFQLCWGTVRTEDKTAPVLTCPQDTNQGTVPQEVQTLTGMLTGSDAQANFANYSCYQQYFGTIPNGNRRYDAFTFTVNQTDVYTLVSNAGFDALGALYAGSFDASNPCDNIVAFGDETAVAGGFIFFPGQVGFNFQNPAGGGPVFRMSLPLQAGQSYTLVTTSYEANATGAYNWVVYSDGAGQVSGLAVQQQTQVRELVCDDIQSVLFSAAVSYLTDASGQPLSASQQPGGAAAFQALWAKLGYTGRPTVSDNCGVLRVTVSDAVVSAGNCGETRILRTFRVEDQQGGTCDGMPNVQECVQEIVLRKARMTDVIFPPFTAYVSCESGYATTANGNPSPSVTGYPFLETAFGTEDLNQVYCNLGAQYSDHPRIALCGGTYEFVRRWTVLDNCAPGTSRFWDQIIRVVDSEGPRVSCPVVPDAWGVAQSPIVYATGPYDCTASFTVPLPEVAESCSATWTTLTEIVTDVEVPVLNQYGQQTGTTTQTVVVRSIADGASRQVTGIPTGNHRIRYTVRDACGNETVAECAIRVVDATEPVVVLNDQVNISLGGQGTARLHIEDIDEGSYDNCGGVTLRMRRAAGCASVSAPFGAWGSFVDFSCCDAAGVNSRVRIEVEATDAAGNRNVSWLDVLVEDKIRPVCYAPHAMSVFCDELPANFTATDTVQLAQLFNGSTPASAVDNCTAYVRELTPVVNLHDCGWGTITRNFQAVDGSGNTSTNACRQVITVNERHNYWIKFPRDYSSNCEEATTLSVSYESTGCDLLAVSTTDERFAASGEECYKIMRTYRVINWCEYDGVSAPVVVSRDEDCDGDAGYAKKRNASGAEVPSTSPAGVGGLVTDTDFPHNGVYVIVRGTVGAGKTSWIDSDLDPTNAIPMALRKGTGCDGLSNPMGHWTNSVQKPAVASRGYWEYTQQIIVYDNVRPTVTAAAPAPFCSYDSPTSSDATCEGPVTIPFSVNEGCTPEDVTVRAYLDAYSDGVFPYDYNVRLNPNGTTSGNTNVLTITGSYPDYAVVSTTAQGLPIGTHRVEIQAQDGCGNVHAVTVSFEVRDCKAPTPICHNGLTVTLMPVDSDGDGEVDGGMAAIWATDFVASPVVDCTPPVKYSLRRAGQAPDINRTGLTFTCADYNAADGTQGTSQLIYLDAWDGAGNRDFCETYILVQDQQGVCASPATGAVSGMLRTEWGAGVSGATVLVSGVVQQSIESDQFGEYAAADLPSGSDYTITPVLDANPLNGVTTFDLVLITRHILGVQLLDSPYRMIAADVNNSGTITTLDVIQLRRLILAIDEEFANNTSWRFVPADYVFPVPTNPWFEPFPEVINLNDLAEGELGDQDFIGVKIGDVNGSAVMNATGSLEDRSEGGDYWLETEDRAFAAGEEVEVIWRGRSAEAILGMQWTLGWDAEVLSWQRTGWGELSEGQTGHRYVGEGLLTASWHVPGAESMLHSGKTELFRLVFRARAAGRLSEVLYLSDEKTRSEAYGLNGSLMGVRLGYGETSEAYALYQNRPNPLSEDTQIGFYLPQGGEVVLTITDMQGRVLRVIRGDYGRGYHQVWVEGRSLPKGVLQYTLKAGDFTATRRMVVTK